MLTDYTEKQTRFDRAFSGEATTSSIVCKACGRVYFVTSPGHGDYEDGELKKLRRLATEGSDRVIEVSDYGNVSFTHLDGKQVVIGCLCDPTGALCDWIEREAESLTRYLKLYWESRRKQAEAERARATEMEAALDDD